MGYDLVGALSRVRAPMGRQSDARVAELHGTEALLYSCGLAMICSSARCWFLPLKSMPQLLPHTSVDVAV